MGADLSHPANAGLLAYLGPRAGKDAPASQSPDSVSDPYYTLGTHPDLVEWLWETLSGKIPRACRWVVYRTPALVHPETGVIFGWAGGTHTYALRLPPALFAEAVRAGAKRVYRYPGGHVIDLESIGPGWVFGDWNKPEADWCLAAYEYADDDE